MSLMDKMKEQAAEALTKAQQGVSQGKAKIDEAQTKHQWDGLLRNLGQAVYAEQRDGGSSDAVAAAWRRSTDKRRACGPRTVTPRPTVPLAVGLAEKDATVPFQPGGRTKAGGGTVDPEEQPVTPRGWNRAARAEPPSARPRLSIDHNCPCRSHFVECLCIVAYSGCHGRH